MQRGIERGSHRVDALHSRILQLLPELPVHRAEPFAQGGEGRGGVTGDQAIQIVQDIEQLGHEAGLSPVGQLGPLPAAALAVVVVLRRQPEMPVLQLGQVFLQPGIGSSQKPGLGVLSPGRRLGAHIGRGDIAPVGAAAGIALRLSHSRWSVDGTSVAIDIAFKSTLFCHFTRSLSRPTKDNI